MAIIAKHFEFTINSSFIPNFITQNERSGSVGLKYENKRKYENTKTLVKSEFLATSIRFRNSAQLTA